MDRLQVAAANNADLWRTSTSDFVLDAADEIVRLRTRVAELEAALRHISIGKCENDTRPGYHCADEGRTPDAKYGADRMCPSCIAAPALAAYDRARTPATPTEDQ